jgi:hypothetical protein
LCAINSLHATPEAPATVTTKTIVNRRFTPAAIEGGDCPTMDGDGGESAHFSFFPSFHVVFFQHDAMKLNQPLINSVTGAHVSTVVTKVQVQLAPSGRHCSARCFVRIKKVLFV